MNQFNVTFKHLYLLVDLHQTPLVQITLSASRFKCGVELESIGLIHIVDNRYYLTDEGNQLVQSFGNMIQAFQQSRNT